jgi:hypothetical protein
MYHCHNLHHEDMGMMLQFIVIEDPNASSEEISTNKGGISVMPNPAHESWIINTENFADDATWTLTDVNGKTIQSGNLQGKSQLNISASEFASGIYILNIADENRAARVELIRN